MLQIQSINVLSNPAKFTDEYTFDITFECLEPLSKGTPPLPLSAGG